ncbi:MAG: phosphatidylglycerophosphatase A [Thermodesulfobacteriota bacterium]
MRKNKHTPWQKCILFLGSGTGLGYMPWASGTFGNLWGLCIVYWVLGQSIRFQAIFLIVSILVAVFLAGRMERILAKKDPSQVVVDEIAGYLTAMVGLPFSWRVAVVAFFLFRAMDIYKPFPIRTIDRNLPGGWGIVLDDVLAGVYCQMVLRLLFYFQVV